MIKKPSVKKVTIALSLKWPLNYPQTVFPSISHTYSEPQKYFRQIHNFYEKPKYKCRCDRSLPRFQLTEKRNDWNSGKVYLVLCQCLLMVYGHLLVVCDHLCTVACTEKATQMAAKCLQTNKYIYKYTYIYIYMYIYIYIYKYTHVYIYIYIYVHTFILYIYIYIYLYLSLCLSLRIYILYVLWAV